MPKQFGRYLKFAYMLPFRSGGGTKKASSTPYAAGDFRYLIEKTVLLMHNSMSNVSTRVETAEVY
jgi:hypothetical protein